MTTTQLIITIIVLALSVVLTRVLPFLLFDKKEKLPAIVDYLGVALPAAMMGLLIVYCFKDYDYSSFANVWPALVASASVVALHLWKRNTILSIALGTIIYMILIRL